jgi:hypothetical protein
MTLQSSRRYSASTTTAPFQRVLLLSAGSPKKMDGLHLRWHQLHMTPEGDAPLVRQHSQLM